MNRSDPEILQTLAQQYLEICHTASQQARRELWRQHHSFKSTPVPIYIRAFAWNEMPDSQCKCVDPFYRHYEDFFRQMLFRSTFDDDFIFEPWVTVEATYITPTAGIWGLEVHWIEGHDPRGARRLDPPLKNPEDIARLIFPHHQIDKIATASRVNQLADAIGTIIPINLSRAPLYRVWNADISTHLGYLRGIEQIMWDIMDRPEWLHQLLQFMRDGILTAQAEAEAQGDWRTGDHVNQAMPYAEELPAPAANSQPVSRKQLWCFCASQETTLIGPAQFNEFMLAYQLPILKNFGLVAYGCCEDLTEKIGVLRQIPNLRRIAVAPAANVARCAEQIGTDYVLSYRPSPTDMVGYGFDPERIQAILQRDLAACRGCFFDITLKDVETVQGDPTRIQRWVKLMRKLTEKF